MFMLVERLRSGHHIYLCVGLFFVVKTECVCENEFRGHMCVYTSPVRKGMQARCWLIGHGDLPDGLTLQNCLILVV